MSSSDLTFDITARDNASAAVGKVAAALQRMDRTAKTADTTHRQLGTTTGRVTSGMRTMVGVLGGIATGYAAIKIAQFGKDSIRAASDLQEATSATGVMFGKQKKAIVDWADTAAQAFGQSRTQAMQSATYFGTLGKAAGLTGRDVAGFSKQMVTLGSDLASFFNTSPADAMEALGAGLRGESEPLRRYGVLLDDATLKARAMKMGIYEGTGTLTQQQRVLAAHAEILKQTNKAQGDFARTQGGWANQTRVFSAQLENLKSTAGKALLPIATDYIKRINNAMPELERSIQKVAPDIGKSLVGVADAVADNWPEIKEMFGSVADAAQRVGGVLKGVWDGFRSLPPGVQDAALQLGAIATAMGLISKTGLGSGLKMSFDVGKSIFGAIKGMNVNAGVVNVNGKVAGGPGGVGGGGKGGGGIPWGATAGGLSLASISGVVAGALASGAIAALVYKLVDNTYDVKTKQGTRDFVNKTRDSHLGDGSQRGLGMGTQPDTTPRVPTGGRGRPGSSTYEQSRKEAYAAARAQQVYKKTLDDARSATSTAEGAVRGLSTSQKVYSHALANSTRLARNNEAGIKGNTQAATRNRSALKGQASAGFDVVSNMKRMGASSQQVTSTQRQLGSALIKTARDMGVPKAQARDLAKSYGLLPPKKETKVSAPGAKNSKRDIDAHTKSANKVPAKKDTKTSAPGATDAKRAIDNVTSAAKNVPRTTTADVNESGAGDVEGAMRAVQDAINSIDTYVEIETHYLTTGVKGEIKVATGGHVSGPGTATSDSIPAWLSDGEYVVRASSVKAIGADRLGWMNATGTMPKFAKGGKVTADPDFTPAEQKFVNDAIALATKRLQHDVNARKKKKGESDKEYNQRMRKLDRNEEAVGVARSAKQTAESKIRQQRANARQSLADQQAADKEKQDAEAQRKQDALSAYGSYVDEARAGIGQGLSSAKQYASTTGFDLQASASAQEELKLARSAVNTAATPAERQAALAAVQEAQTKAAATAVTPANVVANFRTKIGKIKEFRDALAGLRDKGLNPTTLSEIAQMDPESGLTLAKAIAGSDLAEINGLQSQLLQAGAEYGAIAHNANLGADQAATQVMDGVIARGGIMTTTNVTSQLFLDGKQIYESLKAIERQQGGPLWRS